MDKKLVLAELDYILNMVKGSFDVTALVRYLTATGKWDKHIKDMAKTYGLKIKSGLNIDKLIESTVQSSFRGELAPDQIEDISTWIKIKLFYPKALSRVDEEDLPEGTDPKKDIFTYMLKSNEVGTLEGMEGKFVSLIKSMTKNNIRNYKKVQKNKGEQVLIKDVDEDGLENDLDKLVDDVEKDQYTELLNDVSTYIEKHGEEEEKKVYKLRIEHDLSQKEIADKMKVSDSVISNHFKSIRRLLHKYAMLSDNVALKTKIEERMNRFKEDKSEKKSNKTEQTLEAVVSKLESLIQPKEDKLAKIASYINKLSSRIQ